MTFGHGWRDVYLRLWGDIAGARIPDTIIELADRLDEQRGYVHYQSAPAGTWIVNHNFGREPTAVRCLTVGGVEFDAEVVNVTTNQIRVVLAAPAVGRVLVSR